MLLQARREMSARELADELGVSIRTVYRDMSSLQTAGIPIYADAGRTGGYRLLDGYRTRLTGLTTEEAQALFLTGVPKAADDLGLGAVVAGAERKLEAALPPELRQRAETVRARFHLDAPGWYDDGEATPHLSTIAGAVWEQRRVAVLYRRWKEPSIVRRVLDPLGIVLKAGRWYLVARVDERQRAADLSSRRDSRSDGDRRDRSSARRTSTSRRTGSRASSGSANGSSRARR